MELRDEVDSNIIALLNELGLSTYEARAYTALLKKNPISRYELAKISGVPSPKIYEAVQKLYERSYVLKTADDVPLITPIEPADLIADLRENKDRAIKNLSESFDDMEEIFGAQDLNYIWNIAGTDSAYAKAEEVIGKANSSIYLAGFSRDLKLLEPMICAACNRKVKVRILAYGPITLEGCEVAEHFDIDGIKARTGGRWMALVRDQSEVLVSYPMDDACESVWTNSPVLSLIISKYVDEHFYSERLSDREHAEKRKLDSSN